MLVNFRQGLVSANQSPPFIVASPPNVNLVASFAVPVILDFAMGDNDILFQETNNIASAWTGLPGSGIAYLYWDINLKTAVRTFGFTTLAPIVSPDPPASPANGQMWYDTTNYSQNFYSFGSWNPVLRVFAGQYSAGTVTPYTVGSQIGSVMPVTAGYILFDDDNNPIKKYQTFNLGEFITTASPLASQFSKIQNYTLGSAVNTALVSGNIAQWQAVCYVAQDTIGIATSNAVLPPYGTGAPAIGVAPQNMPNGTVQPFLQQGYISDLSFNSIFNNVPVGSNVFIDTSGFLTPTPPNNGTLQVMGYVVDSQTLFICPQPAIAYADISAPQSPGYIGQTSITTLGTITTGTWDGTTIAIAHGGTGQTSQTAAFDALSPLTTTGDIIYSSSGTTASRLGIGSTGQVLTVVGGIPAWTASAGDVTSITGTANEITASASTGAVTLSIATGYVGQTSITTLGTITTGTWTGTTLAIANGGTGQTGQTAAFDALSPLTTQGDIVYFNGTHNVRLGAGTAGYALTTQGTSANPTWSSILGISASTSLTNLGAVPQWIHVGSALPYSTFSAGALTNSVTLFSLPGGGIIQGVKIKHSTAFSGGSISGYTISVGISTNTTKYATAFNVFQAVATNTLQLSTDFGIEDNVNATNILATATSTGANLNAATAGVVDIWALLSISL